MSDGATLLNPKHPDRPVVLTHRDGVPVVVKRYEKDRGTAVWQAMLDLWASPFGERRRPPGLSAPLDFDPQQQLLTAALVEGRPLSEGGTASVLANADHVGALLADFHRSGVHVARIEDVAAGLHRVHGRVRDRLPALAEALARVAPSDEPLVPVHGDLSAANVWATAGGATLIDFDTVRMAGPGHDAAYLAAWCWVRAVFREHADPSTAWVAGDAVQRALVSHAPEWSDLLDRGLAFHRAKALVRCASWGRRAHGDDAGDAILAEAMRVATNAT